ncbi:uncharacterized protein BDW70DRAFT_164915 [Aspergillus foveolatus]|uniref:uncharacterized protein n=1 Tax=Aspergillus foveolatus TaxID=210207 RepID=UPI003CCDD0B1
MAAACGKELLAYVPAFTSCKGSSPSTPTTATRRSSGGFEDIIVYTPDRNISEQGGDVWTNAKHSTGANEVRPLVDGCCKALSEPLGLHQLYASSSSGLAYGFDVVAFHGLGHSHSTWTVDDTLWLRDLLLELPAFQTSRIFTFNYDSRSFVRPHASSIRGRTFTFGEALICDLADKRFSTAALRHAHGRRSIYGNIADSTRAILFFGTPHQGSDVSAYLGKLRETVLLGRSEIVDELAQWSALLAELTTPFSEVAPRYIITTFFEQKPTKGVIIVAESSAGMGQANERIRGLDADHISLCRFTRTDSNWKVVASRLEAIASLVNENLSGGK